ncbi:pop3 peptide [Trifolium pratense]|uniref:Pop3 peptide n=1 Tax=Trifolium pratense TaxID=57577 RepID=A0A2K3KZQ9_TRIPR|nr:stress-response A/B barrel domain-containing protein HS1-like [Trifolium pratense]XP_045815461.1 stress-response A/B barrel domain-containing protein HS1-like [Trifolium pratense]PNX71768.1 pop3 peptide [Trifolium pratense]
MAEGIVKHIVLSKFKDETSEEQIDEIIKGYANLVNLIPQIKSFRWGKDVSAENLNQGFTHIYESTFDSVEAIAEFIAHPSHVEYANLSLPYVENVLAVDYKPTIVNL